MKKFLVSLIMCLTVSTTVIGITENPANAGFGSYDVSWCRGDVEWNAQSDGSIWYRINGTKYYHVWAVIVSRFYGGNSYECGWFGAPRSNMNVWGNGWRHQNFEGGDIWYNIYTNVIDICPIYSGCYRV